MSEAGTKTCPQCAETIKAAAKVCPCCQSRLSRCTFWQQELAPLIPVVIVIALTFGGLAWLEGDLNPTRGRSFAPNRSDLAVLRTALQGPIRGDEFDLAGFVTNRGSHPWQVEELEVRFLNSDGSLRDVRHPEVKYPFVVQPGGESAFRVELGHLPLAVRIAPFEARVQDAKDGNLPYDPD